jgi:hypothetical protein
MAGDAAHAAALGERVGFRPADGAGFLELPPVDLAEVDDGQQRRCGCASPMCSAMRSGWTS